MIKFLNIVIIILFVFFSFTFAHGFVQYKDKKAFTTLDDSYIKK